MKIQQTLTHSTLTIQEIERVTPLTTGSSFHTYKMLRLSTLGARSASDAFKRLKIKRTIAALPYPVSSLKYAREFVWKGYVIDISIQHYGDRTEADLELLYTPKKDLISDEPDNWRVYNEFNPGCCFWGYQKEYRKRGYSRHDSWLLAEKSMQNDRRQELSFWESGNPYIEVTASKQDMPLGKAKIELWDYEYIEEAIIAYDLIEAAIADAIAKAESKSL
jgi:IS1 family transposase